ncbi:hypothetical protein BU16DRAFT_523633 [Lophium mytilinum]|uniref:Small secreted protein n=1 Tax=Lophium mytilinum TaxID=390894 RepID=A0A6A6R2T4_9PEZI|nr:hypothetical protein BU16DRAFT_523633 [Lophium mytilinum]
MLSKTILLSLAALATSALASPTVRTDSYYWTVERFTSTCTAATCRYDFNVTGAYGPLSQPSFDAYGCDGETGPGTFEPCATLGIDVPGSVKTKELNLGDKANVFVEFYW